MSLIPGVVGVPWIGPRAGLDWPRAAGRVKRPSSARSRRALVMACLSIQRNHDTDHLLGPYQAAVLVARVEGVGTGALHVVVPGRDDGGRDWCERTMVVGLQLGHAEHRHHRPAGRPA